MNGLPETTTEVLGRASVLIVEDEALIAEDLRSSSLSKRASRFRASQPKLSKALSLIETVAFDAAIVDANLAGSSAGPAAAALAARGLPFIVLSGYTRSQLQSEFSGGSFIQKPFRPVELIACLSAILRLR